MKRQLAVMLAMVAALGLSACGYHFRGGGELPGGVKTVYIKQFQNKTSDVAIETQFTSDLVDEFLLNRKEAVVQNEKDADAVIQGVIRASRTQTISRGANLQTQQRRLIITADVSVYDRAGKRVWFAKGIKANQQYDVSPLKQDTLANRRQAMLDLSKKMAQKIYDRLTENF